MAQNPINNSVIHLSRILDLNGIGILNDSAKLKALLLDYCAGEGQREIIILTNLLDEGIPQTLLDQKERIPYTILKAQLHTQIIDQCGYDEDLVNWALDAWAVSLKIIEPEQVGPPKPLHHPESPDIRQAIELIESQNFRGAIDLLNNIIRQNPDDPVSWRHKGLASSQLNIHNEAIHCYEESLKRDPNNSETWREKGYSYSKLNKYRDAISAYDTALGINPSDAVTWRNKGYVLSRMRKYPEAIECFEAALSIKPDDAASWSLKGRAFGEMGLLPKQIAACDQALSYNPNYVHAWINKGWALGKIRKYYEALTCYEKALKIDIDNQTAWRGRSYCLRKLRKPQNSPFHID